MSTVEKTTKGSDVSDTTAAEPTSPASPPLVVAAAEGKTQGSKRSKTAKGGHPKSKSVGSNGGGVRHKRRRTTEQTMQMRKPGIRRLARRGGVKKIERSAYGAAHQRMTAFMDECIRLAVLKANHGRRKTVQVRDVEYAIREMGGNVAGY